MTANISDGTLRLCRHVLTLQLQMLNTLGYPALAMRDSLEEINQVIEESRNSSGEIKVVRLPPDDYGRTKA